MKKLTIFLIIPILMIITFIISDYIGLFKTKNSVAVSVPQGTNVVSISKMLKDKKIIRSQYLFAIYSKFKNAEFQAGTHYFEGKSYRDIFNELSEYTQSEVKIVTIPEGMEQREIGLLLEKNNICSASEFQDAARIQNFNEYWFLKNVPVREYELEGYLFPDTYEFNIGDNPENVIKKFLDNFDSKITDNIKEKVENSKLNFDEIITLASIIEREAATEKDFKLVSGIFHNRLNYVGEGDGYLRSCATVQYILKERKDVLSISDTEIESPYNTYKNPGLPIGPVASPGIKTIEAAVFPEKTEYIYFASDISGNLYYATTYSQHQINMRKAGL